MIDIERSVVLLAQRVPPADAGELVVADLSVTDDGLRMATEFTDGSTWEGEHDDPTRIAELVRVSFDDEPPGEPFRRASVP